MLPDNAPIHIESLLTDAVREALRHEDPGHFMQWIQSTLGDYLTPEYQGPDQADMRQALAVHLGRAIWNIIPLPGNHLRPQPMPEPGRNDTCPCGSGRKFKKCCADAPRLPDGLFDPDMMAGLVARELPVKRLQALAAEGRANLSVLLAAAHDLHDDGYPKKAVALLEPVFDPSRGHVPTNSTAAMAQWFLCDCYDALGFERKKERLLTTLANQPGASQLRGSAWARLASVYADRRQLDAATAALQKAQQDTPDDPGLGALEVMIWFDAGETDRARERAQFWHRRLLRKGYADDQHPLPFLRRAETNPAAALAGTVAESEPEIERLLHLVDRMQARPLPEYTLGHDDNAAALVAPEAVRATVDAWQQRIAVPKPFSTQPQPMDDTWDPWATGAAEQWLGFLETHPDAFDSIDIIDDLLTILVRHPMGDARSIETTLAEPLMDRVRAIVSAATRADSPHLPWIDPRNRPALRTLARRWNHLLNEGRITDARLQGDQLLALNPTDNHGIRGVLVVDELHAGNDSGVLKLTARYPNDHLPEIAFARALALYRSGGGHDADAALDEAIENHPLAADYLARARVRRPETADDGYITLGGEDQAWHHRDTVRPLWEQAPGALDWLKGALRDRDD